MTEQQALERIRELYPTVSEVFNLDYGFRYGIVTKDSGMTEMFSIPRTELIPHD